MQVSHRSLRSRWTVKQSIDATMLLDLLETRTADEVRSHYQLTADAEEALDQYLLVQSELEGLHRDLLSRVPPPPSRPFGFASPTRHWLRRRLSAPLWSVIAAAIALVFGASTFLESPQSNPRVGPIVRGPQLDPSKLTAFDHALGQAFFERALYYLKQPDRTAHQKALQDLKSALVLVEEPAVVLEYLVMCTELLGLEQDMQRYQSELDQYHVVP